MGNRDVSPAAIAAAIVFALSVFAFTLFVWISFGGSVPFGSKGYRVSAQFGAEASQVVAGSEARISGVRVGEVKKVEAVGPRIEVEMELDSKYAPLPVDAGAIVRSKTLLGETYVELTPGDKRKGAIPEGGELQPRNVKAAQPLDEVLGSFDAETRKDFRQFLQGIANALEGRGDDVNAALGSSAPATGQTLELLRALDRQDVAVQRLVRDAGRTFQTVGNRAGDVAELVDAGSEVLGTTADRNRQLRSTVRALPGFLRSARAMLGQVEATGRDARAPLREIRTAAPLVPPALREATVLGPSLRGLFADLDPVLDRSRTGLAALTRVVDGARPLVRALLAAGNELVPVVQLIEAQRAQAVTGLATLAAATQATRTTSDGRTEHYLRVLPPLFNEALYGQVDRLGSTRSNPYVKPGGLGKLATGLEAFSCANASNPNLIPPIGEGVPECKVQGPYGALGTTTAYPQLKPAG